MSCSNQNFKTWLTDISSLTSDISIRKHQKNNTLIEQNKNENNKLIILENTDDKRKDIFGNEIKKGGKQKISFIDNPILLNNNSNDDKEKSLESENDKIVNIINVESYKEYNKLMSFNTIGKEIYPDSICCQTCFIF